MARIETSVRIAAPAEVVFAFFVPQRMPYWYGADMQACFEVQDGASDFAVAQKVHIAGNLGKREVSHTAVVTALQQARLFEWRFSDRYGVKGLERWELERIGAGGGSWRAHDCCAHAKRLRHARHRWQGHGLDDDAPRSQAPQ